MNYILEVYSHGLFIPITGAAVAGTDNSLVFEFGIDDHFNGPEWMTTSIYRIESNVANDAQVHPDTRVATFLQDARRDIMNHLDANGFLPKRA